MYRRGRLRTYSVRFDGCSQNDNPNFCQDEHELSIIQQEGSPSGPLLRGVNQIASSIAAEFPDVSVETLACATASSSPPPPCCQNAARVV